MRGFPGDKSVWPMVLGLTKRKGPLSTFIHIDKQYSKKYIMVYNIINNIIISYYFTSSLNLPSGVVGIRKKLRPGVVEKNPGNDTKNRIILI